MTPERLYHDDLAEVWHADSLDAEHVAAVMGERKADLLCVDAPYSDRTHEGHDGAAASSMRDESWLRANGRREKKIQRRDINYSAWTPADVANFCSLWLPRVSAWAVSLTDDVLFPSWRGAYGEAGMLSFQDIACVVSGMTVRLTGDGPSSWTIHAAVARKRSKNLARWGTLDGAYVGPAERQEHVGGKPIWLMLRLIEDYSRSGALVVDPCCGAATAGLAALRRSRRFIGCDKDRATAEIAAEIVRAERLNSTRRSIAAGQEALFR